jgi:hypothetical protein
MVKPVRPSAQSKLYIKKECSQSSLSEILGVFDSESFEKMRCINGEVKLKRPLKDTGNWTVCWGQEAPYDVPFKEPLYEVTAWGRLNLRFPTL